LTEESKTQNRNPNFIHFSDHNVVIWMHMSPPKSTLVTNEVSAMASPEISHYSKESMHVLNKIILLPSRVQ
jgi:hypothetical protein